MNFNKIAIFGAGAVGCYIGFLLQECGFDVDFIARGHGLEALKNDGLFVEGFDRDKTHVHVNAKGSLEGLYDVIFICVKSKDTKDAAFAVKNHLSLAGFAVSLQNGVDNGDIIAEIIGKNKTVPAAIYLTAAMWMKGHLKYMSGCKIAFGTFEGQEERCKILEKILSKAKIKWEYSDNIRKTQWTKFLLNISVNPLTALLGLTFGGLLNNADGVYLAGKLFYEAKEAAFMSGVDVSDVEFEVIKKECLAKPDFKTSMLQDVEANRKPEIEAMLGIVREIYEKNGKIAPYTDMLFKIMEIKFGGWFQTSPRLAADVLVCYEDKILLIDRKHEPYGWAIPGGLTDMYEKMEDTAARELQEETGIKAQASSLKLLGIYSDPLRDPRGHTVSGAYVYKVRGKIEAKAADDAKNAKYFKLTELPDNLAFDHRKIINDYINNMYEK